MLVQQKHEGRQRKYDILALDVLMSYEDSETGVRARRSLELLPTSIRLDPELRTRFWRWDLLRDRGLRECAALEASAADVVVLSAHGNDPLPSEVREWLELWLSHTQPRPYAIGVLLDEQITKQTAAFSVLSFAQRVAEAADAHFFHGFGNGSASRLMDERPNQYEFSPGMQEDGNRPSIASNWAIEAQAG